LPPHSRPDRGLCHEKPQDRDFGHEEHHRRHKEHRALISRFKVVINTINTINVIIKTDVDSQRVMRGQDDENSPSDIRPI